MYVCLYVFSMYHQLSCKLFFMNSLFKTKIKKKVLHNHYVKKSMFAQLNPQSLLSFNDIVQKLRNFFNNSYFHIIRDVFHSF